jgi:hypothetical protein
MYSLDREVYTRDDMAKLLLAMLEPTMKHLICENSGFDFGSGGASYRPRTIALEAWSRMLWGLGPFLAGGFSWEGSSTLLKGLKTGPGKHWGNPEEGDQRFVEMAAVSLSIMLKREVFWDALTAEEQKRLYDYLDSINHHPFIRNNWVLFRVLVNLAFEHLGLPFCEEHIQEDMDLIDEFYTGDGWYKDKVPYDMYNPWAIHFYSLIYCKQRKATDRERCERIERRSTEFAQEFVYFFNEEGACIPYGRSLTYRFAAVCFFSAAAYANVEVVDWGVMKSLVLGNLRWWIKNPIFDNAGILSVGYRYPTTIVADMYNAPGSPYWAFKTFLVLSLAEDHPFWKAEEKPVAYEKTKVLKVPSAIIMHTSDKDVVYLNNGQNPLLRMCQVVEKYTKFAYSIHRGFSTSVGGHELHHLAIDNTLCFSEPGENYFRTKDKTLDKSCSPRMLKNTWKPYEDVFVTTYLIPASDWHVRIHRVESGRKLEAVEGGFALSKFDPENWADVPCKQEANIGLSYPWGSSAILSLSKGREGFIQTPIPNTNLMYPCVETPALKSSIEVGVTYLASLVGESSNADFLKSAPKIELFENWKSIRIDGELVQLI